MSDSDLVVGAGTLVWLIGCIVIGNRTLARIDAASTQVAWTSSLRFGYLASTTAALLVLLPRAWESVVRPWVARPDSGEILYAIFLAAISGLPLAFALYMQHSRRARRRARRGLSSSLNRNTCAEHAYDCA